MLIEANLEAQGFDWDQTLVSQFSALEKSQTKKNLKNTF